jgi:hypothetical protein
VENPILQAASGGRIGHSPGKISGMLIGPPASGKKLASLIARVLNPRSGEASASKITPAGLVGASHRTAEGWVSTPGLIPSASEGVVTLQDAHGIASARAAWLGPLFQELLEDGVLRDSVAGGLRREVSVGVILDLNRVAQLERSATAPRKEAPLAVLRPLLSRLDLVAEIPADPARAWDIGAQLRVGKSGGSLDRLDDEPWVRELRVLVALLRNRHAVVDLEPVGDLIDRVFDDIRDKNSILIELDSSTGDIPTRLKLSLFRLTAASARAHDRSSATEDDVMVAASFAKIKLDALRMYGPYREDVETAADKVRRAYWARREGIVVAEDLAREYQDATGRETCSRTVRRDLKALGATLIGKGRWLMPGSGDGAGS